MKTESLNYGFSACERVSLKAVVFLMLVLLTPFPAELRADDAPVIVLSDAALSEALTLAPAAALELDLNDFSFQDPQPDTIVLHVQDFGRSDYYALSYDPAITRYRLEAGTLRPTAGAAPFDGLPPGGIAFLLFGREASPGSLNTGAFSADLSIQLRIRESP